MLFTAFVTKSSGVHEGIDGISNDPYDMAYEVAEEARLYVLPKGSETVQ